MQLITSLIIIGNSAGFCQFRIGINFKNCKLQQKIKSLTQTEQYFCINYTEKKIIQNKSNNQQNIVITKNKAQRHNDY